MEIVRLRYGKAETRSDTRKEARRLGSREEVAFRNLARREGKKKISRARLYIAFQVSSFASVTYIYVLPESATWVAGRLTSRHTH